MPVLTGAKSNLHPGNDYYVDTVTGTIQRQSNRLFPVPLLAPIWAGPFDWPTAKAMANNMTKRVNTILPGLGTPVEGALSAKITNPLGGIAAVGDFFNRLTQPNTWLRVGEFAAGGLLIYLGLSATLKGTEAQTVSQGVTKPVKKGVGLLPPVREAKIAKSAGKRVARERKVTEKAKQIRAQDRAKKAKGQ